jgi:hypothetical protein
MARRTGESLLDRIASASSHYVMDILAVDGFWNGVNAGWAPGAIAGEVVGVVAVLGVRLWAHFNPPSNGKKD